MNLVYCHSGSGSKLPKVVECCLMGGDVCSLCHAGYLQLTGSMRSHYSSCLASILDREIKGKGALLRSGLDGMQRWSKITFVEYCALFCLCWLVVFYMAWSISGTYCWGIHMLKYKCRHGFYEQWTKVSKFTDQKKLLPKKYNLFTRYTLLALIYIVTRTKPPHVLMNTFFFLSFLPLNKLFIKIAIFFKSHVLNFCLLKQ